MSWWFLGLSEPEMSISEANFRNLMQFFAISVPLDEAVLDVHGCLCVPESTEKLTRFIFRGSDPMGSTCNPV